jgi:RNA polymerase sigma factor (sigma-70 family)
MDRHEWLATRFEQERPRLRSLAYRMLGSLSDAEDAVQEAWIRLARSDDRDGDDVDNLAGWLTTVVARISLNQLRSRNTRREQPLQVHMPDPVVGAADDLDPEHQALVADSVGLALLVVLDTLTPAERLAFVLHDVFAVPFEQIAPLVDRTPAATRQLASRARRRVQDSAPVPDGGLAAQRRVVDAFFTAGRTGNFDQLIAVLHPDVVLRADLGARGSGLPSTVTGAAAVAARAQLFARPDHRVVPAAVNGAAGVVVVVDGVPVSVMGFTVVSGLVVAIDVLGDPERLRRLDLTALGVG